MSAKKIQIIIIAVLGLILLFYAGAKLLQDEDSNNENEDIKDNTQDYTNKSILAIVNGEEISLETVNLTRQSYMQQGKQYSQEQILELLINQTIVIQNAIKDGYNYTDVETESELQKLLSQQNSTLDEYKQQLQNQGLSYEEELQNYKMQLILHTYLDDAIEGENINVTESEALAYYNLYKDKTEGKVPSYEELESQIMDYLQQIKEQVVINNVIEDLRDNGEIIYL